MLRHIINIFHAESSQSFIFSTTMTVTRAFMVHKEALDNGRHPNVELQFLWDRDGEAGLEFHKLESCTSDEVGARVKFQRDYAERARQSIYQARYT